MEILIKTKADLIDNQTNIGGLNKTQRKQRGNINRAKIDKKVSTFVDNSISKDNNKRFKNVRATNQREERRNKRKKL